MLNLSGFLRGADEDTVEEALPFLVNSCGHYKLLTRREFSTFRPQGRRDYQLIYVAAGRGYFMLDGGEQCVEEGGLVVFLPGQRQEYRYLLEDRPEMYWLHFTGTGAAALLGALGLSSRRVYDAGYSSTCTALFDRVIREMQLKSVYFADMCAHLGQELLYLLARGVQRDGREEGVEIRRVIEAMHRSFSTPLTVAEYAQNCNMSLSWFIRSFKRQTGLTPQQYLIQVRIGKARELLAASPYNIGEIASLVGYDNPLYFSRLFRQCTGSSPRDYRLGR